ncbi:transcription initiation factor TFIID subunit 8 [Scomber scombrus]|uniref:Transcription initiation factor TFIID subunit 8 n=1 Tax=Scomber scombrus TaxID=13677 RepID=A0AAV1PJT4_SCOSC
MADPAVVSGNSLNLGGRPSSGKGSTSAAENYHMARRRTLQVVVSALLTECGFDSAEKAAVETLTEMMQSYITEIGRSAKSYCEHTARSVPTLSDTVVTLIEMGFNVDTLPMYAKRSQRMVITAPPVTNAPVTPRALSAGQKRTHPAHIPSHFPEFPDPHTYIKTPTFREPVSDYQVVREKAATQRRDVERALTRFMAKTGETQSLFKDDITAFPSPSCPQSWNCRHWKKRTPLSRTSRQTTRTRQETTSLMIQELTKRTPYFLPAASFPPQKPARTT